MRHEVDLVAPLLGAMQHASILIDLASDTSEI